MGIDRKRILAIDPGFERLGIAVLEIKNHNKNAPVLLFSECFTTDKKIAFSERLVLIGKKIRTLVKKFNIDTLAIETLFFNTNQKTVMRVAEARGVVVYEAQCSGLIISEFSPLEVKVAVCGYGRANKSQVENMVSRLVELPKRKILDDEFDAIAIGITCSVSIKR